MSTQDGKDEMQLSEYHCWIRTVSEILRQYSTSQQHQYTPSEIHIPCCFLSTWYTLTNHVYTPNNGLLLLQYRLAELFITRGVL